MTNQIVRLQPESPADKLRRLQTEAAALAGAMADDALGAAQRAAVALRQASEGGSLPVGMCDRMRRLAEHNERELQSIESLRRRLTA
jgi:hypothetical protein